MSLLSIIVAAITLMAGVIVLGKIICLQKIQNKKFQDAENEAQKHYNYCRIKS